MTLGAVLSPEIPPVKTPALLRLLAFQYIIISKGSCLTLAPFPFEPGGT